MFSRRYKKALTAAALAAGINCKMDSRMGRRTCASLLLQANVSAEKIAALLGNSAEQILDAYGDPDVKNMALDATPLKTERTPKRIRAIS
jgi:integrase